MHAAVETGALAKRVRVPECLVGGRLGKLALMAAFWMAVFVTAYARTIEINNVVKLKLAIDDARSGDELVLLDGEYLLDGTHGIDCKTSGTPGAPIVVRAANPHGARIVSRAVEAFNVSAPYWQFKALAIQGVCADDSICEHAFHVVGPASGFRMEGNHIVDFNAPLKVNADVQHNMPNDGVVEGNLISATHPRDTASPVAFINIDNGSGWIVRRNTIADFHKLRGDRTSFGAFAKGGANTPVFEQNLVLCTKADRGGGSRIGLSLGGGGMDAALCAPHWDASVPCDPETSYGLIRNNVIANCSDVGIYLNRARATAVLHNTLVGTAGIDFRFSSTGEAHGNVLTAQIRRRDGGNFSGRDNLEDVPMAKLRASFAEPLFGRMQIRGDLQWLARQANPNEQVKTDYCNRDRGEGNLDMGALQVSLGECVASAPPPSP
ncbi:MAG TPA: hypothetical protein VFL55_07565 [Acetobacteraceae bacterium]|nr:hypothetical protein [Acetobacteraceae bacterium]